METSNTFGTLPDGAEVLAIVDGAQYLAVRWVMRREATGPLDYYCPLHTWTSTLAGQLAVKDETIAELRTRVAELEARLAGRDEEALAAPAPIPGPQPAAERKLPPGRVQCPHCSKQPWVNKLGDHLTRDHPEQLALAEPTAAPEPTTEEKESWPLAVAAPTGRLAPPITVVPDDPTWSCAACHSSVFARSLRDESLCVNCAKGKPIAGSTNGHLVAA